jgi:hypothetical protein
MRRAIRAVFFLSVYAWLYQAGPAWAIEPAVESCIHANEPAGTVIQRIRMRSTDRTGYDKVLEADTYLKRYPDHTVRLLTYFREPDDIFTTRLLIIEKASANEIYMYMPALFKTRRINARRIASSMYGTDFSYEDIERFYGMLSSEQPVRIPDVVIDGRPAYALESRPDDSSGSLYTRVVSYFDKQDCVIRRVDFFESADKLRKRLVADAGSIQASGRISLPREFVMTDLRNDTTTHLSILKIKLGDPIDDAVFDPAHLKDFRGIK